jgi:predicted O-methyltransferase YrrM
MSQAIARSPALEAVTEDEDAVARARWAAIDDYFNDLLENHDPLLDAALRATATAGLPEVNISPIQGKFLQVIARLRRAHTILEIGTLGGYSTIWLARALPEHGQLVTLEANPTHVAVAQANLARAGLTSMVEIHCGDALETLPRLAAMGKSFDLIFIDADKPSNVDYFTWAIRLSRDGSVIIVDNVVREGEILDATSLDEDVEATRRFNEMLAGQTSVSAAVLQTVGSKGHDGFAIAVVGEDGLGPPANGWRPSSPSRTR